jgi:hypothetical protein
VKNAQAREQEMGITSKVQNSDHKSQELEIRHLSGGVQGFRRVFPKKI